MSGSGEHQMRDDRADNPSGDLGGDIERRVAGADVAFESEDQRHRRVEMRPRNRAKDRDQHHQYRSGRERIAEQLEPDVMAQVHGHDARPDDSRHEKGRSKGLRHKPLRPRRIHTVAPPTKLARPGSRCGPSAPSLSRSTALQA